MSRPKQAIALILFLAASSLNGCRGSRLKPAPRQASSTAASVGRAQRSPTAPSPTHPPRDSEFSVYNNPAFGVSFRYPRNDSLEEDIGEGETNLLTQRGLDAEQPGSFLLPTVVVPRDAYPNTTFAGGSLQFVLNPTVTEQACRSFASPPDSNWPGTSGTTVVHGMAFQWRERGYATAGTVYENREYTGFSGGTCYEFFLQVASFPAPDDALSVKQANISKIFRPLEKIVESLQIRLKPAPIENSTLPVVHSFLGAPLSRP
jgi:hypothetical protein